MDYHDYGGLHEDLKLTGAAMKRRDMLRLATGGVGIGALYLLGRADDLQGIGGAAATCDKIPEDTAGPFPGDGSNGPNVLDKAGVVRSTGAPPNRTTHFEVFPSLAAATDERNIVATSQLAFPEAACD